MELPCHIPFHTFQWSPGNTRSAVATYTILRLVDEKHRTFFLNRTGYRRLRKQSHSKHFHLFENNVFTRVFLYKNSSQALETFLLFESLLLNRRPRVQMINGDKSAILDIFLNLGSVQFSCFVGGTLQCTSESYSWQPCEHVNNPVIFYSEINHFTPPHRFNTVCRLSWSLEQVSCEQTLAKSFFFFASKLSPSIFVVAFKTYYGYVR